MEEVERESEKIREKGKEGMEKIIIKKRRNKKPA